MPLTRLIGSLAVVAFLALTPQALASIQQPDAGLTATQDQSVTFAWTWEGADYATTAIVFARTNDPSDPVWKIDQPASSERRVIQDPSGMFYRPRVNLPLKDFATGTWYWRLCNQNEQADDNIVCTFPADPPRQLNIQPPGTAAPSPGTNPFAVPPGSSDSSLTPGTAAPLGRIAAWGWARYVLGRDFGAAFRSGVAQKRSCKQASSTRVRCSVSWISASRHFAYAGAVAIWTSADGGRFSYRIARRDRRCTPGPASGCTLVVGSS
jgi:hypothetical protein